MKEALIVAAAAALLSSSCSLTQLEGDKLFEADRLPEAADSYQQFLDKQPRSTPRTARALYHLGLIYALPESPIYDLAKAEETLRALVELDSAGLYGRQAALILQLQVEVSRLREESAHRQKLAALLEEELALLEEKAAAASSAAGAHEGRARQLSLEIGQLRRQIERLSETLRRREEELTRLKEIDLQPVH